MSKKCPYCDSYNTEVSVGNYVVPNPIANPVIGDPVVINVYGHMAGRAVLLNIESGEIKGYHCCNCGKDFSA